ncbi:MAG TPA: DoxX family protein [Cytophagales bacterium]|nr:DoxX family protein [Cytophagales bacterium]
METTIWTMQGILAAIFTASGLYILINTEKLKSKLSWLNAYSPTMVAFICIAKIAGAIGLVLPMLTGILPVLTPLASIGIALIMLLALVYHVRKKEYKDMPATIIFFIMAMFVALYRVEVISI